jgi:hypothetical protein
MIAQRTSRAEPRVSFTVAVPVYNEVQVRERLHGLVTEACGKAGGTYPVLYVNHGSPDGTAQVLRRMAALEVEDGAAERG